MIPIPNPHGFHKTVPLNSSINQVQDDIQGKNVLLFSERLREPISERLMYKYMIIPVRALASNRNATVVRRVKDLKNLHVGQLFTEICSVLHLLAYQENTPRVSLRLLDHVGIDFFMRILLIPLNTGRGRTN